jgi:inosine/xanthosine triphosphatase
MWMGSGLMEKIIIAVGSKRGPKLGAVTEALDDIGPLLPEDGEFEVVGAEVESGVGHTPASSGELMRGARQRAEALVRLAQEKKEPWNFFVGLEGGLEVLEEVAGAANKKEKTREKAIERRVFLESWAYVTDGKKGYYGRSGGIELPEALAYEVLEKGTELSVAIDKFAGSVGIRDGQGAWGVLSANLISRQEAFRVAVIAAFAPFYNAKMYSGAREKRAK